METTSSSAHGELSSSLKRALIVSTIWAFALGALLELSDQEAYYWTWSQVPSLCYFEHPPLQAWITGLLTSVLGHSAWVVRLPATLGRLGALGAFWLWARDRVETRTARLAMWIVLPSFFMVGGGLLALPDVMMLGFAILAIREAERHHGARAGLYLGLSALGKWTAAMLIPGMVYAFLCRSKSHPKKDVKGLFKLCILAALLQAPVLWWNAHHHWHSFLFHLRDRHHMHGHSALEIVNNFFTFAGAQLLLGGLGFAVALVTALAWARRKPAAPERAGISLAWWAVPAFVVFGYSALFGELRFYWTVIAFFPVALGLAKFLSERATPRDLSRFARREEISLYALMALVSVILIFPVGAYLRPLTERISKYDLRQSPRGDLKGWREWLREDVLSLPELNSSTAFLASDFRLASQIAWALKVETGADFLGRVSTVRDDGFQYEYWPHPQPETHSTAILFGDNRHRNDTFFKGFCAARMKWQTREIQLMGHTVKKIRWAFCSQLAIPDHARKHWTP